MSNGQQSVFLQEDKLNEFLETLVALMPCYVCWKDEQGRILGCNDIYAKLAGFTTKEKVVGLTDLQLPWKGQAKQIRQVEKEVIGTGVSKSLDQSLLLPNGNTVNLLSKIIALYTEQNKMFATLTVAFNIDQHKVYENELKDQQDQTQTALENILNNVPAHIFWKDKNCILLGCNELQAQNMGFSSAKEMVGKSNFEVINPNQPVEVRRAQAEAITQLDKQVMATGETYIAEEPLVLPDGTIAIYLSKKSPLRNNKGEIVGILGVATDITEKKRIEEELQETRHKLEGMTLVSASLAHELRTPLATINIGINNIQEYLPLLLQAYRLAEQANLPIKKIRPRNFQLLEKLLVTLKSVTRAAFTFIDMLLMNVRPTIEQSKSEVINIVQCIEEALEQYPYQDGQKHLINWNSNNEFLVRAKSIFVTHLLYNLIKNALHYIVVAQKGEITIWLERGDPYNRLYFKDTGAGIADEVLPFIFDRFFTRTYHGAGIGLTFCKMLMESIGGAITCDSKEGSYTQFMLSFPKVKE